MSSGASKTSPKAANSDANLYDHRAGTLVPSLTRETLSDITDEGLFERLAAAVLRIAEPAYHAEFRGHLTKFLSVFDSAQELSQVPPELHQNFNLAIY